eukprot:CAMPEP_0117692236 /NCGR_PEP_ID=MMETSP0804-20121206/26210_1 /TAXON_ID=1074897 /ORGANISM="Tetraselmis astigmatica, Strain CCMP880" /LENGTH=149 /DNA_ID=CAMNT_0005505651 /DNA_START=509 /DNA_END=955 /DNA_ORIENTATION=-
MSRLWRWYLNGLETSPLVTKSLTSGVVFGSGDALCQKLESSQSGAVGDDTPDGTGRWFDPVRCGQVAATGLLWTGPATHCWFQAMEFMVKGIGSGAAQLGSRLALDAAFFSPTSLAGYMAVRGALEGKSAEEVGKKMQEKYCDTLKVAW